MVAGGVYVPVLWKDTQKGVAVLVYCSVRRGRSKLLFSLEGK